MQCNATTEGLCALHGSSVSQVTRSADGREMIEAARPSIGWDPGRPNGLHHLLTHPTLPRNDATTTENISVPIPLLNPFASMRAPPDEDTAALGRTSITCGWDPGSLNEPPLLLMHPKHSTIHRNDATTTEMNIRVPIPPLNPSASIRARQDEDNGDALDRPSIDTCGWDPGRQNGLHLLLLHPTILRRDATTTELNIRVPIPPINPSVSMRARQDEDNDDALDRPSIDTCGWDPGTDDAEASLSDCETVFACPAYNVHGSTFADDFDVAGERARRSAGMDRRRRRARQRRRPGLDGSS
jgi:hypothetical protein